MSVFDGGDSVIQDMPAIGTNPEITDKAKVTTCYF
jgi:hypothetical protein